MGIALAQKLEIESVNPHAVFEQVKALTDAVSNFKQSSYGNNGNDSAELAAAKQQIVFLTRSLDRITELFYRSNNQPYQQQAMTNASTTSSIPSTNTSTTTASTKSFVAEDILSSATSRTQNSSYTERNPSDNQKSQKIYPPTATISSSNTKRKRDSPETVAEDINHAIDAIMEFNDNSERAKEHKFYIGIGSVRDLCGRGDKAIRRVLDERKDEIAKHLDQHQLDQNHNLSRRDPQGNDYPNIDQERDIDYHKITKVQ